MRGVGQRLVIDRNDAVALLARALRQQLLQPRADVVDAGRGDDGDLVAPGRGADAQHGAELDAGILQRRRPGGTGPHHQRGRCQELLRSSPIAAAGTMPKFDSTE